MQIEELLREVRSNVPTASVPMISRVMRSAIDDFFCRSRVYRHACTDTPATMVSKYRLRVPEGTRPCALISAVLDGRTLALTSPRQLDLENPGWRDETGRPRSCWLERDTLHITPVPETLYILSLHTTVALTLTRTATELDTAVAEEYFNTLVDGTLARLYALSGVPWTNPQLAQSFGMSYESAVEDAKCRGDCNDTAKVRVASYGGI